MGQEEALPPIRLEPTESDNIDSAGVPQAHFNEQFYRGEEHHQAN